MTDTLVDRIARQADARPDRLAIAFPPLRHTWSSLHELLRRLAGTLAAAGVAPGERLAVLSDSPAEQGLAFLGAIFAGAVPAILSHPSIKQSVERFVPTFTSMLERSATRHLVCSAQLAPRLEAWLAGRPGGLQIHVLPGEPAGPPLASAPAGEVAFLQYSSGTTGLRKGVMVSHAMLLAQALDYADAIGLTEDDTVVSWLPLYHDMGLVGALLIPMLAGAASVHISPFRWVQEPASILDLVAEHRAAFAWFPNFAFRLLASRVPAGHRVDLSSLKALVNSGEPVRPAAFDRFLSRFAAHGLRPEQLQCSYGMAENTFAITQTAMTARPARDVVDRQRFRVEGLAVPPTPGAPALELMSSGRPMRHNELRIRRAGGALAADREVGEIEIRSPCLFAGYEAQSGEAELLPDGFFKTGDLGYLVDGELYVSGRIKDLIIHRGINLHPEDLEEVLGQVPGTKPGRAVAFGVEDEEAGTELVVAMLEAEDEATPHAALATRARAALFESFGVTPSDLVVVAPGTLLKSTSGKLSRGRNRELYLERRGRATSREA